MPLQTNDVQAMLPMSEKMSGMYFPAIWRLKIQKTCIWCLPWVYLTKTVNYAHSKEIEYLEKNGCRQKCLDKSLPYNHILCVPASKQSGEFNFFDLSLPKKVDICFSIFEILSPSLSLSLSLSLCANFQVKQIAWTFSDQISPKIDLGLEIRKTNVGIRIIILEILCQFSGKRNNFDFFFFFL